MRFRHIASLVAVTLAAVLFFSGCKHPSRTGPAAEGSAPHLVQAQADAVAKQTALLALQTTEMETEIPAAVQRAIPVWKDALVALTDDVLASQPAGADAAVVQRALQVSLPRGKAPDDSAARASAKAAGKNEFEIPEAGDYGAEVKGTVSELQSGLLLADVSFGIQCGDDHVLLGYSNASGHWRRVLRWQAPPYTQVSGAFGDMFLPLALKPQRNGHPVLLVVHGTPWCTSTESRFAMDTFEVDPSGAIEKPFWHGEHDYRRADELFKLKATEDGFDIRTSVDDRVGDSVSHVGVIRYVVAAGAVQRTLPIAMNSRESVSEWLSMSRAEARLFTDAPAGSATWAMWEKQTYEGKSTDDAVASPSLDYGEVRACADPKHYQVEIKTETHSADFKSRAPGPSYYVQVQETGNGYRIGETGTQPSPACVGRVVALKSSSETGEAADAQ